MPNRIMFKRHRVLLGLLLEAKRIPSHTELMKWVFLLRQETCLESDPSFYDFVPYKHGPFSFMVYRDLEELARLGYLNGNGFDLDDRLIDEAREAYARLPDSLQDAVHKTLHQYGRLSRAKLVQSVYSRYPWFAERSKLSNAHRRSTRTKRAVYTAGYEGESIDRFLQKLLKASIERILDVRNNPVSRKYGFSKKTLSRLSGKLDMEYVHLPELGVPPKHRRSLKTFDDYQELMSEYQRCILPAVGESQDKAAKLIRERPSVLICFEADTRCCHRARLAEAISADTGMEVVHL